MIFPGYFLSKPGIEIAHVNSLSEKNSRLNITSWRNKMKKEKSYFDVWNEEDLLEGFQRQYNIELDEEKRLILYLRQLDY